MLNLEEIKTYINTIPNDGGLYLVEKLSDISGFFISNKMLVYGVRNIENIALYHENTEYLEMYTNIEIASINNFPQFKSGKYNLLEFKIMEREKELDAFINLCAAHTEYMHSQDFYNFFKSLIDIFQESSEQSFKNVLGLFGELITLKYIYDNYKIDISPYWHLDGCNSKYDFSLSDYNLEVKTTSLVDNLISIKHEQIFNYEDNVLVVVHLTVSEQGKNILDLIGEIKKYKRAFKNFNFLINLEKELKRIKPEQLTNELFIFNKINFYDTKDINPFRDLPNNIYKLQYEMDFTGAKPLEIINKLLK